MNCRLLADGLGFINMTGFSQNQEKISIILFALAKAERILFIFQKFG